jgi:SAM-dependent methyltransferase
MHHEVIDFLSKTKERFPEYFNNKKILELGSLNINGTPRIFFENCEYVGVDRISGRDVDVVCNAHEFKSKTKFDVIISTEMLEHDKYADLTIKNAWKLLKKGGVMIITTANINRPIHFDWVGEDNHYENISRDRVVSWAKKIKVKNKYIEEDEQKQDIRFIFWK